MKKFEEKEYVTRNARQLLLGFYTANKYELSGIKQGDSDDMFVHNIDFSKAQTVVEKYQ